MSKPSSIKLYADLVSDSSQMVSLNKTRLLHRTSLLSTSSPLLKKTLLSLSAGSFLLSAYSLYKTAIVNKDILYRKQQLTKSHTILNQEQLKDLAWKDKEGQSEWLHRQVQVTGRPIHGKQMMVPRIVKGHKGFDCIVPLVTSEQDDGTEQYGMLLNMGWIPLENKKVENRYRQESAEWQKFECIVTSNTELERSLGQKGNNYSIRPSEFSCRLNEFSHLDLSYMAQKTNFVNWEQSKLALVEQVKIDNYQGLNEKGQAYHLDATQSQNYPILKNQVGALQQKEMPWNLKQQAQNYGLFGGIALACGAVL